jgi:NAD(P)-dependent dehydrogenase (short-subunit alcohol dehydrogenase family)
MKLAGRRALITGASQGFGEAVARAFVAEGAHVMLCARDASRLELTKQDIVRTATKRQTVLAMQADISVAAGVDLLVAATLRGLGGLDVLVCNAGVYGPMGSIEEIDWEAWVAAIEINLLGGVYTCRAAIPHLKSQRYGKIIVLSGGGATNPLPRFSAYAASKAAVVRFSETLAGEVQEFGIDVNAVAPGALNTRLLDEVLAAGPEKVGQAFHARALRQKEEGGAPIEQGAALCVFLASAESDGITGRLISALWDPWTTLAARRGELENSDIYTLRRIIPEDRGKKW